MIALAALFAARRWEKLPTANLFERVLAAVLFALGVLWWVAGGLHEIVERAPSVDMLDIPVLGLAFSCVAAEWIGGRVGWQRLRAAALALLPVGILLILLTLVLKSHPFARAGSLAWALFAAALWWGLWRARSLPWKRVLDVWHGATLWWLALLLAPELHWLGEQIFPGSVWAEVGWGLAPALVVALAINPRLNAPWPEYRDAVLTIGALPLLAWACIWLVVANIDSRGDPVLLVYLPLLNPLDIVSMSILLAALYRFTQARQLLRRDVWGESLGVAWGVFGALTFLWLNAALLRTLHHWAGVPFDLHAMLASVLVQTSLSIFWTSLAFAAMFVGTRARLRVLWFVGAGLLAVVVAKLFAIDLARTGTLARIVSFIVVGVLLLLIGYLAPVPPRASKKEEGKS